MRKRLLILWCCGFRAVLASTPPHPILDIQIQHSRPFGYVIGDIIHQTVLVTVERDTLLDRNSLPRGPLRRWLEVREAEVREEVQGDRRHYRIELAYQCFYAPLEVKNLSIPAYKLTFSQTNHPFEVAVPPWIFTTAPIRELSVLRSEGLATMRPDEAPDWPDRSTPRWGLILTLLTGLLSSGYLAYLYDYLPWWRRGRHFAAACRLLRAVQGSQEPIDYSSAYATIHRAFNGVYGQPLFLEQLEVFFTHHPAYASIRLEIEAFFRDSYELFFTEQPRQTAFSIPKLLELCRACRDIERG
jgi:mxaA protein